MVWPRAQGMRAPIAGKAMGLPGGRGSPIERRDRDGGQAPSLPVLLDTE
jgi:hypothetical protein